MRNFQRYPLCPPGEPCHVYVTLPYDTTTSMFINFHIAANTCEYDYCNPTVYYHKERNGEFDIRYAKLSSGYKV